MIGSFSASLQITWCNDWVSIFDTIFHHNLPDSLVDLFQYPSIYLTGFNWKNDFKVITNLFKKLLLNSQTSLLGDVYELLDDFRRKIGKEKIVQMKDLVGIIRRITACVFISLHIKLKKYYQKFFNTDLDKDNFKSWCQDLNKLCIQISAGFWNYAAIDAVHHVNAYLSYEMLFNKLKKYEGKINSIK